MLIYESDKVLVSVQPIRGICFGVYYEEGLLGDKSQHLVLDVFLFSVIVTW